MRAEILIAVATLMGAASAVCVQRHIDVVDAGGLNSALANAQPGDTIALSAGVYSGHFVAKTSGQPDCKITLLGAFGVTLDGGSTSTDGAVLTVYGSYWNLALMVIQNGRKGLVLDGGSYNTLSSLQITSHGEECLLFRNKACNNQIYALSVGQSGKYNSAMGYGIAVGADDNDPCTDNAITSSAIGDRVTQQAIIVRKSSSRTNVHDNSFTSGISGQTNFITFASDSNQLYLCSFGNPSSIPLSDGIRMTGTGNVARYVSMDLRGSGYGYNAIAGNTICKSCTVVNAALGPSSIPVDTSC